MKSSYLKALYAIVFINMFCLTARAQLGHEYAQYDLGFGGDVSRVVSSDVETVSSQPTFHFNFNYNISPFVNYIVEAQAGTLKGGSETSVSKRVFSNDYTAVIMRGQIQAGELIDYSQSKLMNGLKNFYISSGIGFVVNKVTVPIGLRSPDTEGFYSPGRDHSNQLLIPFRIGYEFKIFNKFNQPSVKIDLGYQYNYILGDDLDGFETGQGKNDVYDQLSIGVKFSIGGITSYRKSIPY